MNSLEKQLFEKGLKVFYIDHSIAFRVQNNIYLNKNLLKYPNRHDEILRHELKHSSSYTLKDFGLDMVEGDLVSNFKFCLRYPKAFFQLIPITIINKKLSIDVTLLIQYIIIFGLIWFTINTLMNIF